MIRALTVALLLLISPQSVRQFNASNKTAANGSISLGNHAVCLGNGIDPQPCAYPGGVTAGSVLIACMDSNLNFDHTFVTDTQTLVWADLFAATNDADGGKPRCVYAVAASTGAETVTFSVGFNFNGALFVAEAKGVGTLDKTAITTGTGTAVDSGATATTTAANEFVFGFGEEVATATTLTCTGSSTEIDHGTPPAASGPMITCYKVVSATGAYHQTATAGASVNWVSGVATFK